MSDKQWWAVVTNRRVGPFDTRQAAYDAFRAKYPQARPERIATGYGSNSAWFDIRWNDPKEGAP